MNTLHTSKGKLTKNFYTYELVGEASSTLVMVKFSLLDVPADLDSKNLPDPETMLRCHYVLTRYGIGDFKRTRSDLFDTNISKDKGKLGSKRNLKIVRFGKPLEPFAPPIEDGFSRVKIPGIEVAIAITHLAFDLPKVEALPPAPHNSIQPTSSQPPLLHNERFLCSADEGLIKFTLHLHATTIIFFSKCLTRVALLQGQIDILNVTEVMDEG
ncbi:hypothetical protein Cgig2_024888 [Carnegiea gigantea]|uniref:Uncharacterized protein n=1 Tax=Carnegiea gigantea TaxID=171969 RepID=A0A9Q1Q4H1_9CARY|nr:hypothetical protein Cgig2_024888 [Carnegiea gigantea]